MSKAAGRTYATGLEGFERSREHSLLAALYNRRTRRVSRGISFKTGRLAFAATHEPQPLSALEEALLVASVGVSGLVLPDNPSYAETGAPLAGTVLLRTTGRTAPSPDSAQASHWFVINDSGTYLIKQPDEEASPILATEIGPDELVAYVDDSRVQVLDHRLTFPHTFPAELHRNRFASNVPGSTLFYPVLELTEQYINGLLLVFSQEQGKRPVFRDDWNFYRKCGLEKWIRSGYLNPEIPIPLSHYGRNITEFEALFQMQNLALMAEAMGLGGWVHFAPPSRVMFGGTELGEGLGFRFEETTFRDGGLRRVARPATQLRRKLLPFPAGFSNPVGLEGHIHAFCPPYYKDMDAAIDAILEKKLSRGGIYKDPRFFGRVIKPEIVDAFLDEVPPYPDEAIACVRALCNYVYETYGRFPAHADAMHAPPTWFQVHHVETDFYDAFYQSAYSAAVGQHQRLWHEGT